MMMTAPRIRLIQSTLVDGDIGRNLDRALQTIAAARGEADLVVFSETYVSGFPTPENVARLAEPLDGPSISAVRAAAKEAGVSVAIGFAENDGGRFYNTAVLIDESGAVLLKYRKTHLYESDEGVFERGDAFPVCDWHGVRVGLLICFDLEFPETARMLARNGAELIVIADGMMNPYGHVHRRMIPVRAMENQVAVVMANRVGEGERYTFCGQSQAVDADGERIAIADAAREDVLDVTLDLCRPSRVPARRFVMSIWRRWRRFRRGTPSRSKRRCDIQEGPFPVEGTALFLSAFRPCGLEQTRTIDPASSQCRAPARHQHQIAHRAEQQRRQRRAEIRQPLVDRLIRRDPDRPRDERAHVPAAREAVAAVARRRARPHRCAACAR